MQGTHPHIPHAVKWSMHCHPCADPAASTVSLSLRGSRPHTKMSNRACSEPCTKPWFVTIFVTICYHTCYHRVCSNTAVHPLACRGNCNTVACMLHASPALCTDVCVCSDTADGFLDTFSHVSAANSTATSLSPAGASVQEQPQGPYWRHNKICLDPTNCNAYSVIYR